jgi:hypothetical protein
MAMSLTMACLAMWLPISTASVDFETQVLPVLTARGCNTGACHGAALGQGGFALSLWGSDPGADHAAITRQFEGRRVNLARPERSLLLLKPSGLLDHGGGARLETGDDDEGLLLDWLRAGAPRGPTRRLVEFTVEPEDVEASADELVPLRATARFDRGSPQDVTAWTVFTPTDPGAIELHSPPAARLVRRGQHVLTARFMDRIVAVRFTAPLHDSVPLHAGTIDPAASPRANFIDDEILDTLTRLRLPVSPPAGDGVFLRRASLDLTGTLPRPDETRRYLADPRPDKRERLIDDLLASPRFVDYWTLWLAGLLRLDSRSMDKAGADALHGWIRQQVTENTRWDAMVRELLTASGDSHAHGPAAFARATANARDQAEHVSQVFLGARLRCANCHNHPLDRWTQDDYHGLAAVFARLDRRRNVQWTALGEVTHPRTGAAAAPRLPGGPDIETDDDPRPLLAAWITSPDNPFFARSVVNRLWQSLFGRGLVEPVDDLRATNPATHPALLERLAEYFVADGYDLRRMLRLIATSDAYARGAALPGNASDDRFYSHALARPLSAEVLADALSSVLGQSVTYPGASPDVLAVMLVDRAVEPPSLAVLGRCGRDRACDGPSNAGGLGRSLHLLNGPLINAPIASPQGRLAALLREGWSIDQILDEFYLRALCRLPSDPERRHWSRAISAADSGDERRAAWEDWLWALVNSQEFTTR